MKRWKGILPKVEHMAFHPPLVHFPIAFYCLELLLLIFWQTKKDPAYLRFAQFSFRLGYILMLAAIAAGLKDAGGLSGISGKVRPHFYSALAVFVIYTVRAFVWKFAPKEKTSIQFAGALFGTAAVLLTAFLGGEIVY